MEKIKCKATTKAGNPCKANAVLGGDYCNSHQPKTDVALPEPDNGLCGHINMHVKDENGEYLVCAKVKDHTGKHEAEVVTYTMSHPVEDPLRPGVFDRVPTGTGKRMTYWSEIAGTPADQIVPDLSTLKGGQPFQEKDIGLK